MKAVELYKKKFKKSDPRMICEVFLKLGDVYKHLKDFPLAYHYFNEALAIYQKYYGENHIKTATVLRNRGQIDLEQGHFKTAENFFGKALKIFEKHKHPDGYMVLEALSDLHLKKSDEAANKHAMEESYRFTTQVIKDLKNALEIVKINFPINSPHRIRIQGKLKKLE